ncbi:MAG: pantoate--beta-alanine ligase [Lishizhenia sp.]
MVVLESLSAVQESLKTVRKANKKIGFVPTMGALHQGHLSLIAKAKESCDVVVASIFVNPTQFNNSDDLDKYPRMPEKDAALLEQVGCDFLFLPSADTIYPESYVHLEMDLSPLDEVMEGKFRPGHFAGVVDVVSRLFDIVKPTHAFFGRKDFQQVMIIKFMTKKLDLPVEIIVVDTVRENNGLAMSSRNLRLSDQQKQDASVLYETLSFGKEMAPFLNPQEVLVEMLSILDVSDLELEYLEIVDAETLLPLTDFWLPGATACVVAYCGEVRLIDNLELVAE